jgi:bifunctional non-homologous end joining protein LigD
MEPMKAKLVAEPPKDEGWLYEVKFDGFRALAFKHGSEVRLLSRSEKDFAGKFPEVVDAVAELPSNDFILDGEIAALDQKGRSSFQLLQAFELGQEKPPLFFYVFDLLRLDGEDLRRKPLHERKERLELLLKEAPSLIRYSPSLTGTAKLLLHKVGKLGLEGLIGKRKDSIYEEGSRSGSWIKLKLHREQEFVIGGYTNPGGSRRHFGALIVGYHERGKLMFAGKVGTGFNTKLLGNLHREFKKIARPDCPFVNLPEKRESRYGQTITASQMKLCHWLKPEMVCQVRFAEWTRDGSLRQPVFLGIREDKDAKEVIREKAK